jgi:hypothetical protein
LDHRSTTGYYRNTFKSFFEIHKAISKEFFVFQNFLEIDLECINRIVFIRTIIFARKLLFEQLFFETLHSIELWENIFKYYFVVLLSSTTMYGSAHITTIRNRPTNKFDDCLQTKESGNYRPTANQYGSQICRFLVG